MAGKVNEYRKEQKMKRYIKSNIGLFGEDRDEFDDLADYYGYDSAAARAVDKAVESIGLDVWHDDGSIGGYINDPRDDSQYWVYVPYRTISKLEDASSNKQEFIQKVADEFLRRLDDPTNWEIEEWPDDLRLAVINGTPLSNL